MSYRTVALVSVLLTIVLLVACGQNNSVISALKVGGTSPESINMWPTYIAEQKGWLSQEGIEQITYTYSRELPTALVAGELDLINDSVEGGLIAVSKGTGVIAVRANQLKPEEFLVTLPKYQNIGELKGKVFAVSGIPSTDGILLLDLLKKNGISENEVTLRKVGFSSARLAALQQGEVDGTLLSTSAWLTAVESGVNTLADPAAFGEFPWNVTQVRTDWAKENEDALVGYLRAVQRASEWLYDRNNFDEAVQLLMPKTELSENIQREVLDRVLKNEALASSRMTRAHLDRAVDILVAEGAIPADMDVGVYLDNSYYDKAR